MADITISNKGLNEGFHLDSMYEFGNGEYSWEDVKINNSFQALRTYFTFLEEKLIRNRNNAIIREDNNENDFYFDKEDELFEVLKVARYSSLASIYSNFEYILARICAKYSKQHFTVDFKLSKGDGISKFVSHIDDNIIKEDRLKNEISYKVIMHIQILRHIITHNGGIIVDYRKEDYENAKKRLEEDQIIINTSKISGNLKVLVFNKGLLDYTLDQMRIFLETLLKELDIKYLSINSDNLDIDFDE